MKMNFEKSADGLIPAIIQDADSGVVLMLGFMNEEALTITRDTGKVTFFSRTKNRIWTKGETSGNFLLAKEILPDCDRDTLLIKARPLGPACHTGSDTCFEEPNKPPFLSKLEQVIYDRKTSGNETSYTASLFAKGIDKVAQKVGEEAVEVVIEAMKNDDEAFKNEAADLLFHYLVLLQAKGMTLKDVTEILQKRHGAG